jgi:Peptidase M15
MITKEEVLMGRDKLFPNDYNENISDNIDFLLEKVNVIRAMYNKPLKVSSGFRPPSVNKMTKGAAPNSAHCTGEAVDLQDLDGSFRDWCLQNLKAFKDEGLYIEDFRYTKGWVHITCRKPQSGKRIFIPEKGLPPHPENWPNPTYESKFDSKPI